MRLIELVDTSANRPGVEALYLSLEYVQRFMNISKRHRCCRPGR
jgi:hypothetical protein